MPKIIIIDGVIGWDIYPRLIRRQFDDSDGKEIEIHLASPGGFVFDGLEIYNIIRDYNENVNKVKIIIKALAASMASYISLSVPVSQRYAEDNAVFMIHNPWSFMIGDYRDMKKEAKELEAITNLLAKGYSNSSSHSITEILQLMNDETWLYGDEMLDSNFVSEIIKHDNNTQNYSKDETLLLSKQKFDSMLTELKKSKDDFKNDLSRAAALISINIINKQSKIPASAGKNNNTEVIMNLEEFKKNHPELYAQVIQIGKDEEYDRAKAHITMGKQSGSLDIAMKHIEEKTGFTQAVSAEYMAAGMKNQSINNRKIDDPDTKGSQTGDDGNADTKDYTEKLLKKRGVKNVK